MASFDRRCSLLDIHLAEIRGSFNALLFLLFATFARILDDAPRESTPDQSHQGQK
jgi:hypothetical protein